MNKEKNFAGLSNICYAFDTDTGEIFEVQLGKSCNNPNQDEQQDSLLQSTQKMYRDIDRCITNLVDARQYKDGREQEVLTHMESLMVAALQQFGCVIDYLEEEKT